MAKVYPIAAKTPSNSYAVPLVRAPQVWQTYSDRGENATIAVIDTGVDYNHPDLKANMWKNSREIPGNGIDDDGNGYRDDVYGYDFANNDNDPMDDNSHGTHCAGIIAGALLLAATIDCNGCACAPSRARAPTIPAFAIRR